MTVSSQTDRCGKPSKFFIMEKVNKAMKRFYICEEHSLIFMSTREPIDHNFVYPCEEEVDWIR